ncbi:MAG: hypothetical protein EOP09_07230 [Proteobacteria bacterium]|nr:MAG: hypothetical protein EOP09_07230 [Pseudomonadota bacterium]
MTNFLKVSFVLITLGLTSCASSTYKARQVEREKVANSSGLYCDWVNGDKHSDVEVEVNLQMAKRCDANKAFSLTNYKNNSDQNGLMYCCALAARSEAPVPVSPSASRKSSASSKPAPVSPAASSDDIVEDK